MKKNIIIGIVILAALALILVFLMGSEDSWIKDERGVWIKHGNPSSTPDEVEFQQRNIRYAEQLYEFYKNSGMEFSSQCLGTIKSSPPYAVDIVHVPRTEADDLQENQCKEVVAGTVASFIELDKNGDIVRIVE